MDAGVVDELADLSAVSSSTFLARTSYWESVLFMCSRMLSWETPRSSDRLAARES